MENEQPIDEQLNDAAVIQWQEEKRAQWESDLQAVRDGKLRIEDLSWAHRFGWGKAKVDFTSVDAALKEDEDAGWAED